MCIGVSRPRAEFPTKFASGQCALSRERFGGRGPRAAEFLEMRPADAASNGNKLKIARQVEMSRDVMQARRLLQHQMSGLNAGVDFQRSRLARAARAGVIEFRDINLEPDASALRRRA